jgi:fermentation-respiration switch protein FrsA (DUF1100 family)
MSLILALIFGLVVVGLAGTWVIAGMLVEPLRIAIGDPPTDLPAQYITLNSGSGADIVGWHIPSDQQRGVIVLAHPYRGSRLDMLNRARLLHRHGFSIVMVDLQAHGESPGERVTIGHLERHDVASAIDYATEQHPGEPLGVIGFSMGGAATLLSKATGIDALVLEAAYPTIQLAIRNRVKVLVGGASFVPTLLLLMQFRPRLGISPAAMRPIDHLPHVSCPVLIMSGTADLHTTVADTESMFAAASEPKQLWMVEGAGHEDLYDFAPDEYEARLLRFLNASLQADGSPVVNAVPTNDT